MIFILLIGATIFSLVFRGLEGDVFVNEFLSDLPGDVYFKVFIVMATIFLLGFILDFIEITYVVVPVVAPVLLAMGIDPIWLGILIAINLQTSFNASIWFCYFLFKKCNTKRNKYFRNL